MSICPRSEPAERTANRALRLGERFDFEFFGDGSFLIEFDRS
jgi:hypothetical protein